MSTQLATFFYDNQRVSGGTFCAGASCYHLVTEFRDRPSARILWDTREASRWQAFHGNNLFQASLIASLGKIRFNEHQSQRNRDCCAQVVIILARNLEMEVSHVICLLRFEAKEILNVRLRWGESLLIYFRIVVQKYSKYLSWVK